MAQNLKNDIVEALVNDNESKIKPILVIFPGMCSDETEIYVQNATRDAWKLGYQPVLI